MAKKKIEERIEEILPKGPGYNWVPNKEAVLRSVEKGETIRGIANSYKGVRPSQVESYLIDIGEFAKYKDIQKSKRSKMKGSRKASNLEGKVGAGVTPRVIPISAESFPLSRQPNEDPADWQKRLRAYADAIPHPAGYDTPVTTDELYSALGESFENPSVQSPILDRTVVSGVSTDTERSSNPGRGERYVFREPQPTYLPIPADKQVILYTPLPSYDVADNSNAGSRSDGSQANTGPQPSTSGAAPNVPPQPTPSSPRPGFWKKARGLPYRAPAVARVALVLGLAGASIWGLKRLGGYVFGGSSHKGNAAGIVDSNDSQETDGVRTVNYTQPQPGNGLVPSAVYDWKFSSALTDGNGDGIVSKEEAKHPVNIMYRINTKFDNGKMGSEMRVQDHPFIYILKDSVPVSKSDSDFKTFDLDTMVVEKYGVAQDFYTAADLDATDPKTEDIRQKFSAFDNLYRTTLESKFH